MKDVKTQDLWLMHGDCLERMKEIESGSVDMILADASMYNQHIIMQVG